MKENQKAYVYFVRCSDGSLYCGYTTNVARRLKAHNKGKGAKYTKAKRPVTLVYLEEFDSKVEAMKREYEIHKSGRYPKSVKEKMVEKYLEKERRKSMKGITATSIEYHTDLVDEGKEIPFLPGSMEIPEEVVSDREGEEELFKVVADYIDAHSPLPCRSFQIDTRQLEENENELEK